ncbi:MAG: oligoendopeptidase F [Candidatus Krumholzibacteriia bacterium]
MVVATGGGAVPREAIQERYTWDLAPVFTGWESWEAEFAAIDAALPRLETRRGTLGRSAPDLLATLEEIMAWRQRLGVLHVYASMRSDEDTRVGEHTARDGRADTLAVRFGEAVAWFEPELLAIPPPTIAAFLDDLPGLRLYAHFIDDIQRLKEHTLDADREELLAGAANLARGAGQVFNALNNADIAFGKVSDEQGRAVELTKARYARFIRSPDRRVRREAFERFHDAYGAVINTLAANLDANVRNHVFFARARKFPGTLEGSLGRNAIPTGVFHALARTVNAHVNVVHRWAALKRRVLGVERLHDYDLYMPLFPEGEFRFTYDEAQTVLLEALAPLGPEYVDVVRRGIAERWIDVHENAGKRSGAYSSGAYGTPPYILLNWSDTPRDVFTLAHEMGHSLHTWLATRSQPYVYGDYPIFTAEVASTLNEALLLDHLLRGTTDRGRRLFLLDHYISQINDTVFRQTMFAEFEYRIHRLGEEGETLTAEALDAMYLETVRRYWGPDVEFDPERSGHTWCRIPHFYYNFYVYQYATACAAATALARGILAGEPGARDRYLGFLRSGSSRYPVETLQLAGVDVTTPAPVEGVIALFGELLGEMERLLEREER